MYVHLYKYLFHHLQFYNIAVGTHHLSASSLMIWHGAATASLESGILTEESRGLWRCCAATAAVKYRYSLVTEMEGKTAEREGGKRHDSDRKRDKETELIFT